MASTTVVLCTITTIICYITYQYYAQLNRIPGPKGLPILGNIKDLPPPDVPEYQHWLKHKDLYGGISSVNMLGLNLILIHDKKLAHDLLEQSASKTSGRPKMVMANELCGYASIVLCQNYTPEFRRARRFLHRELGTKVLAAQFQDAQASEVARQLVRALDEPERMLEHFRTTAAATMLKMAYGYTIDSNKPDMLISMIERTLANFSRAAVPMGWAIDILPALRYLPDNFPGATFKKTARKWRNTLESSAYIPYRFVQRRVAADDHRPSYVSKMFEQLKHEGDGKLSSEDEQTIIWTAASLYGAASDTTVITLKAFTLAMLKFPQVQRKAQRELDNIIGTHRLPTFSDREKLPYINAIVKEATRWWPVTPMGFPHTATQSFYHEGLYIPRGAYLLPAVWWFLHDPAVYSDPESFDPERFLPPRNEPDPESEAFGYGRRKCPGRFFADAGIYLSIVQTLAAFNIGKAIDENGKEIEVDVKPGPGILTHIITFDVQVKPRSARHVEFIRQLERQFSPESGDAGLLDGVSDWEDLG